MPKIVLTDVTKRWGSFYAVDHLNLTIDDCSFITLLGPSGCGKTTTLRMIAGLDSPTTGRITIGDEVVFDSDQGINVPANKRHVGFLFQNYALWPNMTVYQNISFGLANVKEEMPVVCTDALNNARIAEILQKPDDIIALIEDCKDKKGQIDADRAYVKLIDTYTISIFTAKEIYGLGLHKCDNAASVAANFASSYAKKYADAVASVKSKGFDLNEKYEYVKDGQVVKKLRKMTKEEIDLTVRSVSRVVKIGMFMNRYPAELSGGQQQRVAIARTLAPKPTVLFMDEPLSNLDAKLRLEMRSELQRLHLTTGSTFVYVTHDQLEAMTLATKICLIENGNLQQYDAPLTVYNRPNNLFVADFVGNPAINFADTTGKQAEDGKVRLHLWNDKDAVFTFNSDIRIDAWKAGKKASLASKEEAAAEAKKQKGVVEKGNKDSVFRYPIARVEDPVDTDNIKVDFVLGIRPETIKINNSGKLEGEIYSAMPTGMETTVRIRIGNYLITGVVFGGITYEIGEKVKIDFSGEIMLFDRETGDLIDTGKLEII